MSKMFAEKLRACRIAAGFTQEDLAKAVGITRNAVANYEIGRSEPSLDILSKIITVLDVPADSLVLTRRYITAEELQRSAEEKALLTAYWEAKPVFREAVVDILKAHKGEK